jgi:hypothetical protein
VDGQSPLLVVRVVIGKLVVALLLRGEAALASLTMGTPSKTYFFRPSLQKRSKMARNFSIRVVWCALMSFINGQPVKVSTKFDMSLELHHPAMRVRGSSERAVF